MKAVESNSMLSTAQSKDEETSVLSVVTIAVLEYYNISSCYSLCYFGHNKNAIITLTLTLIIISKLNINQMNMCSMKVFESLIVINQQSWRITTFCSSSQLYRAFYVPSAHVLVL